MTQISTRNKDRMSMVAEISTRDKDSLGMVTEIRIV